MIFPSLPSPTVSMPNKRRSAAGFTDYNKSKADSVQTSAATFLCCFIRFFFD